TERAGAISPDGKYFAFVSENGGAPDIWVRQVSGGEPVQVTRDAALETDLVYAPDGESVYYATLAPQHATPGPAQVSRGSWAVWRVASLGGAPRKILDGRYPAPSLDGKRIAYVRSTESEVTPIWTSSAIELANSDGSSSERIYAGWGIGQISWSPDGRWLAFTEGLLFDTRNISIIDVKEKTKRPVTNFTYGSVFSQAWLPDSQRLLFSRIYDPFPVGTTADLGIVAIHGGSTQRLTLNVNARFVLPSLSTNGGRLLATLESQEREMWRVPLGPDAQANGAAAARLLDRSWDPLWTQVSRDGSSVLFNSRATGSRNLWTMPLEVGGAPRQITVLPGAHPALSPDGTRVAYSSHQTGNAEIWVLNVDGSNPLQLTHDPAQDFWPAWSSDGKWILFGSTRTGIPQLWKIPAEGGKPVQLTQASGVRGDWSPVANRIVYTAQGRLEVADAEDGKILLKVPFAGWTWTLPVWSPDGRRFTAVQSGHPSDAIWIFDAETGQGRVAVKFPGRFHMLFRAAWGKDGQSLIVNRSETISHIVLLENF
ncbi:MAG: TolB family protein, partial [Gammaproteobacteria bacterium]